MNKIFVNGNPLDIMVANKQQKVTPGCSEFEPILSSSDDPNDACSNHQCQKGRCSPIDVDEYECKCKAGWSGQFCDQGKR